MHLVRRIRLKVDIVNDGICNIDDRSGFVSNHFTQRKKLMDASMGVEVLGDMFFKWSPRLHIHLARSVVCPAGPGFAIGVLGEPILVRIETGAHEQQVAQTIQVGHDRGLEFIFFLGTNYGTLGAPTNRPGLVKGQARFPPDGKMNVVNFGSCDSRPSINVSN